jgi:acetyltransferase-like isoleucine patch superfamily enzyme
MALMKKVLFFLLSFDRKIIWNITVWFLRRKHGEFYSLFLREIFKKYRKIDIGLYTHGGCFKQWAFPRHTTIGRYCSIARSARAYNRDHPVNFMSTHAFFFNANLKYCEKDLVQYIPLEIGHDVWIGDNAIILSTVKSIGTGAVIAAGSLVNKDVPPYALVLGNPARVVRYRFSPETIAKLLESKWWEMPIEEIKKNHFEKFIRPYDDAATGSDRQNASSQNP